jgi:hypothetical protein
MLRFVPDQMKFELVGTLKCPAGGGASPFSMALDRNANAYVLYRPGTETAGPVFKVSTEDASCESTPFVPGQAGLELFGMAFSANSAGDTNETLYVAGNGYYSFQTGKGKLASVAFPNMNVSYINNIQLAGGSPDLAGTGGGELWGFFPNNSPPLVGRIDKTNGQIVQSCALPSSQIQNTKAWAFAYWGGKFILFFQSMAESSTSVYGLDPISCKFGKVLNNIGYTVTGAGVSSCAPTKTPGT